MSKTTDYLTLKEAAAELKVSERTIWELAREGEIPCFKVGAQYRFRRESLDEWAKQQATQGENQDE